MFLYGSINILLNVQIKAFFVECILNILGFLKFLGNPSLVDYVGLIFFKYCEASLYGKLKLSYQLPPSSSAIYGGLFFKIFFNQGPYERSPQQRLQHFLCSCDALRNVEKWYKKCCEMLRNVMKCHEMSRNNVIKCWEVEK